MEQIRQLPQEIVYPLLTMAFILLCGFVLLMLSIVSNMGNKKYDDFKPKNRKQWK